MILIMQKGTVINNEYGKGISKVAPRTMMSTISKLRNLMSV